MKYAGPLLAAILALTAPGLVVAGAPEPTIRLEPGKMTGRWYEVARIPNRNQRDCHGALADWVRQGEGWSVVQVCHKGSPSGPKTEWKAKARSVDPSNAKIKMSFFGGMVSQEYWVLDHRPDQGWLILATPGGNFLWLMAQRPSLSAGSKAQALARIRQLGYDAGRLEFPLPAAEGRP